MLGDKQQLFKENENKAEDKIPNEFGTKDNYKFKQDNLSEEVTVSTLASSENEINNSISVILVIILIR
jgi:hypothetical protein